MRYFLYKITNSKTGKLYIGKTTDPARRWYEHQNMAAKGQQHPLYDSMRKHGIHSFVFEVIEETTSDLVDALEVRLISEHSQYPKGYNLAKGGIGGDTFTNLPPELKERKRGLHQAHWRDNPCGIATKSKKGKHITEVCPKIEQVWKKNHKESMKILSERKSSGNFTEKELVGQDKVRQHWRDPNNKIKRSELAQGKNNSRWLGYLEIYSPDGDLVQTYESAKEASKSLGIPANTMRVMARSGEPYRCQKGGFIKYVGYTFKLNKDTKHNAK